MPPMRIVILDGYTLNPGDNPWAPINQLGQVVIHDRTPEDQIVAQAKGFDIVVTNKAPLSAATIAQLPDLKFIAVTATGYNIVDTAAAKQRGIPVSNVPDYATDSVAQFVMAMLLEMSHHLGLHDRAVKEGEWQRNPDFAFWKTPQIELAGKKMGIVGFGRIGQRVGRLANAFGMEVLAYNRSPKPAPDYGPFAFKSIEEVFAQSDAVSLHVPLTDSNKGMINASLLSKMKRSAFLINTARGALVNEAELTDSLNRDVIAGAAVDVVSAEPIRAENPLLKAKNIVISPHIAWAALEPRQRVMKMTAQNISAFISGKPMNVVNL